jgi:hypothetical protein
MKFPHLLTCLALALPLASCGALGNGAGKLLSTPLQLLKGMTNAVGRTAGLVSQTDAAPAPDSPAAVEERARAVGARGDYSGLAARPQAELSTAKTAAR